MKMTWKVAFWDTKGVNFARYPRGVSFLNNPGMNITGLEKSGLFDQQVLLLCRPTWEYIHLVFFDPKVVIDFIVEDASKVDLIYQWLKSVWNLETFKVLRQSYELDRKLRWYWVFVQEVLE